MPDIPELQPSQVLNALNRPIEESNPGLNAGVYEGSALEKAGKGLERFASGFNKFEQARTQVDRSLVLARSKAMFQEQALQAQSYAMRNAKDDGSDIVDLYNQQYNGYASDAIDKIEDPVTKDMVITAAKDIQNRDSVELYKTGQMLFVKSGHDNAQDLINQNSSLAMQDPENTFKYIQDSQKVIDDGKGTLFSPKVHEQMSEQINQQIPQAAIEGIMSKQTNDNRFQDARDMLTSYSANYTPKQREAISDRIDHKELEAKNQSWQDLQRQYISDKQDLKDEQDDTFAKTMSQVINATNDVDRAQAIQSANKLIASQGIRYGQLKELTAASSARVTLPLLDTIMSKKTDPEMFNWYKDDLKNQIMSGLADGVMTPQDAQKAYKVLNALAPKDPLQNARMQAGKSILYGYTHPKGMFTQFDTDSSKKASDAMGIWIDRVTIEHQDPKVAALGVVKDIYGADTTIPLSQLPTAIMSDETRYKQLGNTINDLIHSWENPTIRKQMPFKNDEDFYQHKIIPLVNEQQRLHIKSQYEEEQKNAPKSSAMERFRQSVIGQ